tara:strand:- start:559 stop:1332 length:774 start_codon:yes stop_codon:yes gene_type:complete
MFQNVSNLGTKKDNQWTCDCGKEYKYHQSYYRHKKTCSYKKPESKEEATETVLKLITENKEIMNLLLKQSNENKELRNQITKQSEQISELIPKVGNNNINKQFNINVFLNEKCKDAISMKDFIENITITMRDLDFTKSNGNIKGITNIITNNLSKLSLYKRPLHYYDKNKKVLYIKNKEWEEDEDYKQINLIIASVETRQINQLSNWTKENPDYMQSEAKQCEFLKIVNTTMANEPETRDKIIKTLCEKVMLRAQNS